MLLKKYSPKFFNKKQKSFQAFKYFARDVTLFSTKKTKGAFLNKVIDKYKNSKKYLLLVCTQ